MSPSVLDQLTLGFVLLWNRRREVAAVELQLEPLPTGGALDTRALLATLAERWPTRAPRLLLRAQHPLLLLDLLAHGRSDGPALVLPADVLANPVLRPRALQARARGLPLLWPAGAEAPTPGASPGSYTLDDTPPAAWAGQIVRSTGTLAATVAALDQHGAWAIAGWPLDDTLQQLAAAAARPDRTVISRVVRAIEDDRVSMDRIEALLCADPLLAYRFLQHVTTAAPKLRGQIDTLQRGLQVWGLKHVQAWLLGQLPQAGSELDLQPVRHALRLRAQLLGQLLDAGDEEDLRNEVLLCGLYSQLDRLLGEPLAEVLQRLPLSQRILQALLEHSGPYHPALQLARALEATDLRATQQLALSYGYAPQDVNVALLRTLATLPN